MLARVLSAAVNGIEAYPVEVEVNSGWGDTVVVIVVNVAPKLFFKPFTLLLSHLREHPSSFVDIRGERRTLALNFGQ